MLRVYGLHLKPVTNDGFVLYWHWFIYTCNVCAWKALRHRTCTISIATGVLPSRQNYCNSVFRGLRPRLLSLRSVVPSRHKRCMNTNDLLFVRLVRPTRSPFYPLKEISVNFLIFSAALGIAQTSSALHSLARKFALRLVGENNHGRKQIADKILSSDKNQINLTFS